MKILFVFLFSITISLSQQVVAQQNNRPATADQLGREVFETLQNNDFIGFDSLIITGHDGEILANKYKGTKQEKANALKNFTTTSNSVKKSAKQNFQMILDTLNKKGIDWDKVEIIKILSHKGKFKNLEMAPVGIVCKQGNIVFVILVGDCYKSDAWVITEEIKIDFEIETR
jgi:hypothetical protein